MKYVLPFSLMVLLAAGIGCDNSITTNTRSTDDTNTVDTSDIIVDEEDVITIETTDVYGKDIDGIERYPGSVRSYYSSNEYETDVTYQTSDDIETVRAYYNDVLTAAGWTNSEEATDYMEYTRGDDNNPEIMTVYFTDYSNVLEYELVYEPALTAEQLEELDE